jgi:hypothetical protein
LSADPPWPWPITEPPAENGSGTSPDFPNKFSGLWLCGYRTGKTEGLPASERKRFLDCFFRSPLPAIVRTHHGNEYSTPGSEDRLKKMANVLAANCRNFKRNDRHRYSVAISHYETDLGYLKAQYYKAGSFPWPPIEP